MKDSREDRLYELLPPIYRIQDAEQGEPLKALLRVITEQVNLVEDDIRQLYENWFIETCEDWVVPYIGELIGYEPVHEAGEPSTVDTPQGRLRNKILIPRREVANTIRYRRRKGTLALLELLANDVAGWSARAVEFYTLLGWTQSLNHLCLDRGETVDIRKGSWLDLIDSPFERFAHTVDVRRINSFRSQGRHNIPSIGVFVWRLKSYAVTETPAYCLEAVGPHCYTFSVLGNDSPLFMLPEPEPDPTHIADEFNLPVPIRRRLFEDHKAQLYGPDKSLRIWKGVKREGRIVREAIPESRIVPADLSDWQYLPRRGTIAVDPVLGRIAFPTRQLPKNGVWVNYHYGFSTDLGGGEYERTISQPTGYTLYLVGGDEQFETINAALDQWGMDSETVADAVIEITDSGVYVEPINIEFKEGQESLQLRVANQTRPIIRLLDWQTSKPDALTVTGNKGSRFTLDGVMVTGRGVQIMGDLAELTIRHSTLIPGWTLDCDCEPQRYTEPSLEIFSPDVCVKIEYSIIGAIQIDPAIYVPDREPHGEIQEGLTDDEGTMARCRGIGAEVRLDPIRVCISDSVLDATHPELEAFGAPGCPVAHACLTILRSTVFGQIHAHAIQLGENTIFDGRVTVARRQKGCLRFCYVIPESRAPRCYRCQPDLVIAPIIEAYHNGAISKAEKDDKKELEQTRVRPIFNSVRYSTPTYCQLSNYCAQEIKRGADDESEMGVFHDLFQPQRMANLSVRLDEYLPARMDIGIIVSS
ncbi:MAG: hypothetical protein C4B58_07390 [Deltaproteobacteria bacterium]|nr:MAG: hypothetical protein C4B58_07390 [Deltaproteobacteria bacterium]